MVEGEGGVRLQGEGVGVEGDEVDAVGVLLDEAADGDPVAVALVAGGRDGHGVERVGRLVGGGVVGPEVVRLLSRVVHFPLPQKRGPRGKQARSSERRELRLSDFYSRVELGFYAYRGFLIFPGEWISDRFRLS